MKTYPPTFLPLAFTAALILSAIPSASAEPPEPNDDGFVSLFNGRDLEDWDGDPRFWSVVDGVIRGQTTEDNQAENNTFLIWRGGKVKDFELKVRFRIEGENNSGIQYRGREFDRWRIAGYQAEIINKPDVVGFLWNEQGKRKGVQVGQFVVYRPGNEREVLGSVADRKELRESGHYRPGEWNECHIIARGNHVIHRINGRKTIEFIDKDPEKAAREGLLALQVHGGKPLLVEFKDIRLKQLDASFGDARVLFDGNGINEWRVVPEEDLTDYKPRVPRTCPTTNVVVYDVTQEKERFADALPAIACIQGLVNRSGPEKVFLKGVPLRCFWKVEEDHPRNAGRVGPGNPFDDMLEELIPYPKEFAEVDRSKRAPVLLDLMKRYGHLVMSCF